METGIPQLDLPPLDPINIQQIDFRFFNLTIEFHNVFMEGFKKFKLEKSEVDKDEGTWKVELSLPRVDAVGTYKMSGTIPPNLDLGSSNGDERLNNVIGRLSAFHMLRCTFFLRYAWYYFCLLRPTYLLITTN